MGQPNLYEMTSREATKKPPGDPAPARPGMRAALRQSRQIVADKLPAIVGKIADDAVSGNVVQIKLFLEIGGVLKGGLGVQELARREKSLEEVLTEELDREREAREVHERELQEIREFRQRE